MTFEERLDRARKDVEMLDSVDGYRDRRLATILAALGAGLKNPDSNSHFDAYVMLEARVQMEEQLRRGTK